LGKDKLINKQKKCLHREKYGTNVCWGIEQVRKSHGHRAIIGDKKKLTLSLFSLQKLQFFN
jgi:hypothetical protein